MRPLHLLIFTALISLSCCSYGQLTKICNSPSYLEEISAIEYDRKRNVFWVIQDSGNSNDLIALNHKGKVSTLVTIENTENKDWEDLTQDSEGNLYIGDFGNNNKSRNHYKIFKVHNNDLNHKTATADVIEFKLPKNTKEKDFEGFFIYLNNFYLFSKSDKRCNLYTIPCTVGHHKAQKISSYEFKGSHNKVTAACISRDGKTVALLNSDKLWILKDFKGEDFFSGTAKVLYFNHKSQKEGLDFYNKNEVLISDERQGTTGGNIYSFKLN